MGYLQWAERLVEGLCVLLAVLRDRNLIANQDNLEGKDNLARQDN